MPVSPGFIVLLVSAASLTAWIISSFFTGFVGSVISFLTAWFMVL